MKNKFMKVMSTVLSLCMISCMLNGMPSMAEPLQANSPEYPQSFDLREYGLVTSVKDQGDDSTCVSFSTMGTIETSLVDTNPLIDLSEYHFAYFNCYKTAPDESTDMKEFRNYGSKTISAVATLAAWIGAVAESVLPYGTEVGLITESMRMLSEYRLQNSEMLSAYSEERMNINSPVGKLTNNEIKEILYDKNAVSITVSYSKSYYNSENAAYFKNYSGSANHALVIVGWDDAFSRDNFNYYCRPENDGAWLVKNSWGTGWGDDGYFWISYEDKSICDANTFIVEPSDNYANNYQYDSYGWSTSISANNMDRYSSYMANVFTAEENESITAVGFYTTDRSSEYEIKIYRGLTDPCDPISGEAGKVTTGTERYPGYHTVALNEGVEIEKGESFSVVVRLKNPEALYPIAAEAAIIVDERGFNDNIGPVLKDEIKASTEAGQSFISADGVKWLDTNGMKQTRTVEDYIYGDLEASIYLGNVCLKAFSNPTDRIYFSEHSGDVPLGTAVELSGAPEIHYTTDGSTPDLSSPVYSNPIIINAETTIRAFGVYDGKHGSVYTSVYTQGRSALSGLSIDSVPSELYDENGMIKNFKLECSKSQIELSPCSTAKITINGEQVKSSGKIIVPLDFGENTIEIRTFGETGKKETEYTLSAFRSYAFVDYYEERIKFDGSACMVTAENGHRFGENERISDYLGGVLTVKSEDSEYTIKLPERIILENNVNIKTAYSTEALSGLFSYSYDLVYSNYADMRNALPITYRRIDLMLETRF